MRQGETIVVDPVLDRAPVEVETQHQQNLVARMAKTIGTIASKYLSVFPGEANPAASEHFGRAEKRNDITQVAFANTIDLS